MSTQTWVRADFRAAHLSSGPRQVACGRHLGYGIVTTAPDYARRCATCVRIAAKAAAK